MDPLRVFVFGDKAYQVDARARLATVITTLPTGPGMTDAQERVIVKIDGRVASLASGDPGESLIYEATRLSLASEWFDLTLRAAAHDYLDMALDVRRETWVGSDLNGTRRRCAASSAVDGILQAHTYASLDGAGSLKTHPSEHMPGYLDRVRADIHARLCGEPGDTQRP